VQILEQLADIVIEIKMSKDLAQKDRIRLEKAALACPVHKSCHPDMKKVMTFTYI
jgi:hypothetical protein